MSDQKSNASKEQAAWVDLTYQEVVNHINWIRDPFTEEDAQIYYIGLIDSIFPGSNVDDLIFWPNQWFKDEGMLQVELSDEEVAQYLMAWTRKRLVGAESIVLPSIPATKADTPPPVISL